MSNASSNSVKSDLERFAQRLRTLRQKRQLSQGELGELAQTNLNQISRYERGTVAPTADILFRLAGALQVTVGELMDEEPRLVGPEEIDLLERLREIEQLSPEDRLVVKKLLDAFLTNHRVKKIAAQAS